MLAPQSGQFAETDPAHGGSQLAVGFPMDAALGGVGQVLGYAGHHAQVLPFHPAGDGHGIPGYGRAQGRALA